MAITVLQSLGDDANVHLCWCWESGARVFLRWNFQNKHEDRANAGSPDSPPLLECLISLPPVSHISYFMDSSVAGVSARTILKEERNWKLFVIMCDSITTLFTSLEVSIIDHLKDLTKSICLLVLYPISLITNCFTIPAIMITWNNLLYIYNIKLDWVLQLLH